MQTDFETEVQKAADLAFLRPTAEGKPPSTAVLPASVGEEAGGAGLRKKRRYFHEILVVIRACLDFYGGGFRRSGWPIVKNCNYDDLMHQKSKQ